MYSSSKLLNHNQLTVFFKYFRQEVIYVPKNAKTKPNHKMFTLHPVQALSRLPHWEPYVGVPSCERVAGPLR